MRHSHFMQVAIVGILLATPALMLGQAGQVAELHEGTIAGTVTDVNHDTVPGAMVFLEDPNASDRQGVVSNDDGYFEFHNVKPGIPYQVSISAKGFADWHSPALVLEPRQFKILADIELRIEAERTTVNPVTIAGVALYSGMQQAGDTPNYGQGMKGYSKRFGANAAGGISDILIGGAILPSLLHQDPRYLYQGIGTTGSRIRHAMFHPFVCRGDNGVWQPNYSSMGGDLASSALAYTWYPKSDRGIGMVLTNFAINTGERVVASLAQEFLLRRFTHSRGIEVNAMSGAH